MLPDGGAFAIIADEMDGMLKVSPLETDPHCSPVETDSVDAALPAGTFADIDEKDAQRERRAEVPVIRTPELAETPPKSIPTTTNNVPAVVAAFASNAPLGDGGVKERICDIEPTRRTTEIQTAMPWLAPDGAFITTAVSDSQTQEGTKLTPNLVVGEIPRLPMTDPNTDTMTEPEGGTTIGSIEETLGSANENRVREVPVRPAIEATANPLVEGPAGDLHNARLSDIQSVAWQDVGTARNTGETS